MGNFYAPGAIAKRRHQNIVIYDWFAQRGQELYLKIIIAEIKSARLDYEVRKFNESLDPDE